MALHGKDGIVKVGSNTVAETQSWTLNESSDVAESTAQGDTDKTYLPGQKDWTASVTANLDPSDTTGQGELSTGATVTLNLYPADDESGDAEYSGSAIVTAVSTSSERQGIVSVNLELQGTGALTKGTVSA
ncbi:MAG: phage tail tube protein [Oceanicaulis sp.]